MPSGGEALDPAAPEVEAEDRRILEVAEIERAVAVEGEAEREAAALAHHLDARGVGRDAQHLAVLAAAPDMAVGADRHAFGVLEPRLAEDAVEEHARPALGQHRRLGGLEAVAHGAHREPDETRVVGVLDRRRRCRR